MKMIAHRRRENVRIRIKETQTIPVMVVIKATNQDLFYLGIPLMVIR